MILGFCKKFEKVTDIPREIFRLLFVAWWLYFPAHAIICYLVFSLIIRKEIK